MWEPLLAEEAEVSFVYAGLQKVEVKCSVAQSACVMWYWAAPHDEHGSPAAERTDLNNFVKQMTFFDGQHNSRFFVVVDGCWLIIILWKVTVGFAM